MKTPLLLLSLLTAGALQAPTLPSEELSRLLVERIDPQPGETFLLLGNSRYSRFEPLADRLRVSLVERGAIDGGRLDVFTGARSPEAHEASRQTFRKMLQGIDLAVMLPGADNNHASYQAMQDVLREGRGRTVHFHWTGAYDLSGAEREVDEAVDARYRRALLKTDYRRLAQRQKAFEEALRRGEVRVTTPLGTDIRFRVGTRPVTRQDGDASAARMASARNLIDREIELPAGAVRVAPLEESVEGVIAFPTSTWGGRTVRGLKLTFRRGRVEEVRAETGADGVDAEWERAGESARRFREFALGFNPLLAVDGSDDWIPYYGYGAGVVRLSLGDNRELGGQVGGGYVRWNFFVDATVVVADRVWVRDGRLLTP